MKKFLLIALAVVMMMTLAISAFAALPDDVEGNVTIEVKDYTIETVYAVDITWTGVEVTYAKASYTWDPNETEYTPNGKAGWVISEGVVDDKVTVAGAISVTNKSNAAVDATATMASAGTAGLEDVKVSFEAESVVTEKTVNLESAAPENPATLDGDPVTKTFDITVSGAPADDFDGSVSNIIGTITVSVAAAA